MCDVGRSGGCRALRGDGTRQSADVAWSCVHGSALFCQDGIQQMCSDVVSTAQRVIGRKGNGQANRRRKRKVGQERWRAVVGWGG